MASAMARAVDLNIRVGTRQRKSQLSDTRAMESLLDVRPKHIVAFADKTDLRKGQNCLFP